MSRVQLALNVDNLDEAVAFYSKLFNTAPAKLKAGYANFAVAEPPLKLVLIENPGQGGSLNHLGVEVNPATRCMQRSAACPQGMFTEEEIGTTCCFATQDKVWVTGRAARSGRSTPSWPIPRPSAPALNCSRPTRPAGARAAHATAPTRRPIRRRIHDVVLLTGA